MESSADVTYTIGPPRPGDGGWVIATHAAAYGKSHGYDASFEVLVARLVANLLVPEDPTHERLWIARTDRAVGSIYCRREDTGIARLGLFWVDDGMRGQGLGASLVRTCLDFAGTAGYGRVVLTTTPAQGAARRLYARAGFACRRSHLERGFGVEYTAETWVKDL